MHATARNGAVVPGHCEAEKEQAGRSLLLRREVIERALGKSRYRAANPAEPLVLGDP
jgi:hypothetical protein